MPARRPRLAVPPDVLWRVERVEQSLGFSSIDPADAVLPRAGNRFDVLGAGVLYAATDAEGAFAETAARFRPSASIIAKLRAAAGADDDIPTAGLIEREWLRPRRLRSLRIADDALPFVDIEQPETHAWLAREFPDDLAAVGVGALDVAAVRGPDRLVTRAIASALYGAVDEIARPRFGGIRYLSRLSTDYECWAVFEGTEVDLLGTDRIARTNPALRAVADRFDLTIG